MSSCASQTTGRNATSTGGCGIRTRTPSLPAALMGRAMRRLNDWAARHLTDDQRANRRAALLPTPLSGPGFYADPVDLTGLSNGEVIRSESVSPRVPRRGVAIRRFLVRSTDTAGDAVPVAATLLEPRRPWRGSGPRPVVVRNQPINSLGLNAAPSRRIARGTYIDAPPLLPLLLRRGYAVLIPDHEGPRMAYSAGIMAAHAVLDSVRGMRHLAPELVESAMVMDGYSGGAIATAWAAQEQASYAPELRFRGAVCGGTPTDFGLLQHSMNTGLGSGLLAAATIGQAREYPELAELFGDFALYMAIRMKDLPQIRLAASGLARLDMNALAAVPDAFDSPIARGIIEANKPGATAPTMPVLLYHGSHSKLLGDQFIPEEGVVELAHRWRHLGADVEFLPVPGEHMIAAGWAMPTVLRWMRAALAD
ncbi:lipase family protein [Gordonia sp. (in: high G+C Gram-positive bacteria)]|uniref:lipase family protein n=1 Tax=Gordonia sp. (in: high G+C Gram-positive bacteria) TaxID=84139 RepID=UPI0039E7216F